MMRRNVAFGLAFFCLVLIVAALDLQAAPPANDQCSGAEIMNTTGASPWFSLVTTNMHEATTAGDPPQPTACYGGPISKSIWYEFTPPANGLYTVSLKFTATTMEDSLMGIYTSQNGCAGPFTQFACNDDVGGLQSAITTNFNAGTTYYVVIWHTLTIPLEEGQRDVQLKVVKVEAPANDLCQQAAQIIATEFPHWSVVTNTHLATTNGDPAVPFCYDPSENAPQRSVWYRFRPVDGGNYIIATCTNSTATKIDQTMLAVYEGGCEATSMPLACNAGFCGLSAGVIINLMPNTEYYIVVWELASASDPTPSPDETDLQLIVDRPGLPTVTTIGHTNETLTTVTLLAEGNPKGSQAYGFFEWGTTPSYGNVTTNFSSLRAGVVPFPFSRVIEPLAPGSTIFYRAAATNAFGVVYGQGKSVTLPVPRPDITSMTMQPNGFRIQFTGTEGYIHEVQVSEDLRNWERLGEATPLEFDQFEYVDEGALTRTKRFYRIKL
jgi:hypothetical protein